MRLTVADAISPSYFVAIAAAQLGFFQQEGVDVEFVFSPPNPSQVLKDGAIVVPLIQNSSLSLLPSRSKVF